MSRCPRVLAFDVAGAACSAAVWGDGRLLAGRSEALQRGHAERLLPMIQAVMADAGCAYASLDAIAVTCGPGGFTGVRIGLATARGLALASGRPAVGVSNFAATAMAVPDEERAERTLAVVLESKRDDVFFQCLERHGDELDAPAAAAPSALPARLPGGALLLAGDAAARVLPELLAAGRDVRLSRAAGVVDAAAVAAHVAGSPSQIAQAPPLLPLYLRPPDVTLPPAGPQ